MSDTIKLLRENKWKVGDVLESFENGESVKIKITAIGEENILAKCLTHGNHEAVWVLNIRPWTRIQRGDKPAPLGSAD